ncbi:MAG: hypothetical protein PVF95_04225 [bacterium]
MKYTKLMLMLLLGILVGAGCVEEIQRGDNIPPRVWFETAPAESAVIFSNATSFEWKASDWDDDLGMGATYVKLDTLGAGEDDWFRVYDTVHDLLDLPDSTFNFRVRVVDPRDAETVITRNFTVRFDPNAPVLDSLWAPPGKVPKQDFTANYRVFAHDIAPSGVEGVGPLPWPEARAASPPESLMFQVRMVGPGCFDDEELEWEYGMTYDTGDGSIGAYYQYSVFIPGATCDGKYTFWVQVRDRARNDTAPIKAEFEVPR